MPRTLLFVASTWSHIANFHRPYLRAFCQMGWIVHAAAGGEVREIPEAEVCTQLPFEKKMTSHATLRAQAQLRGLIREHGYDLVIVHTSLAAFFTRSAMVGLRPRPPLVNMGHGYLFDDATPPVKRTAFLTAERITSPQTDLLLTMNHWDYDTARKYCLGTRIENIPGVGVDFARFPTPSRVERVSARDALGIGREDCLLVYAAEFSDRKNQAMLLRALPLLPGRIKLALPGKGVLLEECRTLAGRLGVERRVLFPGYVTDMGRWYAAADAAVSASRYEGMPFNVMEAMHAALPTVASSVKGHTDLISDGVTGLLYPYGDETAFAHAVQLLLDAPEQAAAMGAAARESVEAYRLDRVLPQVMELYLSALKT